MPGFGDALARLRDAQKPSRGTAAYSRFVNRPVARPVAAAAYSWGLTPNQVTVLSAAFTFTAIGLLALSPGNWWLGTIVAILLAVGYVLDSADGQLARLRQTPSKAGEWLDHTIDGVKTLSLPLAIVTHWFRFTDLAPLWYLVPVVACVVTGLIYFGLILMPTLRVSSGSDRAPAKAENPARKWLLLPADYGFFCWTFVLFGVTNWFAWIYLLITSANVLLLVTAWRKWWRELVTLDQGR
jgi:phosphatidylglycerophosphate synthase